jgi:flagellar motor protein MotB
MTYSDMVTLLLVFFVVLYMLTPGVDMDTLQQFLRRFQGGMGVLQQQQTVIDRLSLDRKDELKEQRLERWQALVDFIEDRQLDEFFEIDLIPEGIKITLSESVTFNSGSSDLLPQAQNILTEIAELFSDGSPGPHRQRPVAGISALPDKLGSGSGTRHIGRPVHQGDKPASTRKVQGEQLRGIPAHCRE